MICLETGLPRASILWDELSRSDYADGFRIEMDRELTLDEAVNVFCGPLPRPIAFLMRMRDGLVGRLGLKVARRYVAGTPEHPIVCQPGEEMGMFRVFERRDRELVLGEDDVHLDFRVSVLVEGRFVTVSTLVFYRNWMGRLYFAFVRPVHRRIVPAGLAKDFGRFQARGGAA